MNNKSKMAWSREGPDEKPFLQGQIGGMLMRYIRNRTQQFLHTELRSLWTLDEGNGKSLKVSD